MSLDTILLAFENAAASPSAIFQKHLKAGKKVILSAPYYAPDEIAHSMGLTVMAVWGANTELHAVKQYYPAFICSIMQGILELGIKGTYAGARAIMIPSLCDSLKTLGQNWKYAVEQIEFIPVTYPQNRLSIAAPEFVVDSYRYVIEKLEEATGAVFNATALSSSIQLYNKHSLVMRELSQALSVHPEITAVQRNAIYKSATFLDVVEHTALVEDLLFELGKAGNTLPTAEKTPIYTTGIVADNISLNEIIDSLGFTVVGDDIAAASRIYDSLAVELSENEDKGDEAKVLAALATKYLNRPGCSVIYDPGKTRPDRIVAEAKARGAEGLVQFLTKFCDPEEFDAPFIKAAADIANLPMLQIEVDRQMDNYEQAKTALMAFKEIIDQKKGNQ